MYGQAEIFCIIHDYSNSSPPIKSTAAKFLSNVSRLSNILFSFLLFCFPLFPYLQSAVAIETYTQHRQPAQQRQQLQKQRNGNDTNPIEMMDKRFLSG